MQKKPVGTYKFNDLVKAHDKELPYTMGFLLYLWNIAQEALFDHMLKSGVVGFQLTGDSKSPVEIHALLEEAHDPDNFSMDFGIKVAQLCQELEPFRRQFISFVECLAEETGEMVAVEFTQKTIPAVDKALKSFNDFLKSRANKKSTTEN